MLSAVHSLAYYEFCYDFIWFAIDQQCVSSLMSLRCASPTVLNTFSCRHDILHYYQAEMLLISTTFL